MNIQLVYILFYKLLWTILPKREKNMTDGHLFEHIWGVRVGRVTWTVHSAPLVDTLKVLSTDTQPLLKCVSNILPPTCLFEWNGRNIRNSTLLETTASIKWMPLRRRQSTLNIIFVRVKLSACQRCKTVMSCSCSDTAVKATVHLVSGVYSSCGGSMWRFVTGLLVFSP